MMSIRCQLHGAPLNFCLNIWDKGRSEHFYTNSDSAASVLTIFKSLQTTAHRSSTMCYFSLGPSPFESAVSNCWCLLSFSDDDFDMSRYSSSGYSSAEVRCLRDQVSIHTLYCFTASFGESTIITTRTPSSIVTPPTPGICAPCHSHVLCKYLSMILIQTPPPFFLLEFVFASYFTPLPPVTWLYSIFLFFCFCKIWLIWITMFLKHSQ